MPLAVPSWMPPSDPASAPYTGYTRDHWVSAADRILDAAQARQLEHGALVDFGDGTSSAVDRLEGFARTFLLGALRIAGDPAGTTGLTQRLAEALTHGVDAGVWPQLGDHSQSTVEAASVAIGLHLTRDTLWSQLDDGTRHGIQIWFDQARGRWCADNNHVLLGAALAAFNDSTGFSDGRDTVENALDRMDDWYRGDGWYTDGDGRRFDHYNAYAFHWYPFFIDRMMGAGLDDRRAVHRERLGAFLEGYQHFFDAHGAPVFQGRSLIYRWAVTAPFWMARMEGVDVLPASRIRRLTSGVLRHFVDGGSLDTGVLPLGWQSAPMPSIVQSYSGSGSPYWAAKGFLGLALPATDPVWTETETAMAIEEHDVRTVLAGPRWLVDARHDDGIVRLHNLGSDGHPTKDDPLYRRLQFTSATRPIAAPGVRDSDLTIDGAAHRAATRASVGVRGGSVTRALDAGGRQVVTRIAARVLGTSTLYVARVSGAVGLTGRVSGSALVQDEATADDDLEVVTEAEHATVRGARLTPASGARLRSAVRVLGAWSPVPGASPVALALDTDGVVDRVQDGDDGLLCPAVRLTSLPADLIVAWQTDLSSATGAAAAIEISDPVVHEDHVALTADGARLAFRWSLSEPFAADVEGQLIRRP